MDSDLHDEFKGALKLCSLLQCVSLYMMPSKKLTPWKTSLSRS